MMLARSEEKLILVTSRTSSLLKTIHEVELKIFLLLFAYFIIFVKMEISLVFVIG